MEGRRVLLLASIIVLAACFMSVGLHLSWFNGQDIVGLRQDKKTSSLRVEDHGLEMVNQAFNVCQKICMELRDSDHMQKSRFWTDGPCFEQGFPLLDANGEVVVWACDVAHCPRIEIDNEKVNQCHHPHWIELDSDCKWLRYRNGLDVERTGVLCSSNGSTRIN